MTNNETKNEVCCPKFDPAPWEGKTLVWDNKLFIRESIPVFFHIPWPPMITKVMTSLWNKATAAAAGGELRDFLCLTYDPSPWKCEYYLAVSKEVSGSENVKLSGTFMTKVFDGPYSAVPKWVKEMDSYLAGQGKKALKYYINYTTCPKCAKKYGHNYVVFFAQVA